MKAQALLMMTTVMLASSAFAANFGTGNGEPPKPVTVTIPKPPAASTPAPTGPQVTGVFRIVRPDGSTVIQQTPIGTGGSVINVINVATTDAFVASNGKCAFNVKYDEVSGLGASNTTKIDLVPNVLKTIWTQPYLVPGQNNVKIVVNADSATPSVGWVRVNVGGTCGATPPAPSKTEAPKPTAPKVEAPKVEPPKTTPPAPVPAPIPRFMPGSAEWSNLNNAFGYSNYGVAQLKGKPFARYTELVKLNADITLVINAKVVDQLSYNALMSRWNSFVMDPAFQAAMKAITPSTDKK
jgi:hypothetical protein